MRSIAHGLTIAIAVLSFGFVLACGGGIEPRPIPSPPPPEPTPSPRALTLPADDASHRAPNEWWYYNGHLETSGGSEYSFHFVIFQTETDDDGGSIEFGQAGITDVARGAHHYIDSSVFSIGQGVETDQGANLVRLDLGGFSLKVSERGDHSIKASDADGTTRVALDVAATDVVMLHEGVGWMDWPFGWTYYYTYPRMSATGTLTIDGKMADVTGEVWFDHQWGDFFVVGKPAGWQWLALHLDNGDSLMVSEVRGADGAVIATDGTLIVDGSEQFTLDETADGISLDVLDYWQSPATGGEYPARWRLKIDSFGLDALLTPTIADQEVPPMPGGNKGAAYWEGRVDVLDADTQERIGLAFVELSGYVDPDPLSWRSDGE